MIFCGQNKTLNLKMLSGLFWTLNRLIHKRTSNYTPNMENYNLWYKFALNFVFHVKIILFFYFVTMF